MADWKQCPLKKCQHFKPKEQWLAYCKKECVREFYYDSNGGGMEPPEGIKDEFEDAIDG